MEKPCQEADLELLTLMIGSGGPGRWDSHPLCFWEEDCGILIPWGKARANQACTASTPLWKLDSETGILSAIPSYSNVV